MRAAFALVTLALLLTAAAPVADADPLGEPQCYYIYREYEVGPVTVIQRSSCDYEAYLFGEPIIG